MEIRAISTAGKMQIILLVFLMFAACLFFVQWAKQNVQYKAQWIKAALVIGFIFICLAIGLVLIADRLDEMEMTLIAVLLAFSALLLFCFVHIIKENKDKINREAFLVFLFYVFFIFCGTVLLREKDTNATIQTNAFSAVKSVMSGKSSGMVVHMFLNFVLFVPYGFLLAMIYPDKLNKALISLMAGIALSIFAETMQMVFQSGMCDLDDIIANSVGSVVGQLVYDPVFRYLIPEKSEGES